MPQACLAAMDPTQASTTSSRMAAVAAAHVKLVGGLAHLVVVAVRTVTLHLAPHLRDLEEEMACRPRLVLQLAAVAVQVVQDCRGSLNAALKFLGEVMAALVLLTQSQVRRRITAAAAVVVRTITPVRLLNLDVVAMAAAETVEMVIV